MSWAVMSRRVRDASLAMPQRVTALHSLLANHHAPFGFLGTRERLYELAGVGRTRRWTEPQLLAALDALEESRTSHLRYRAAFAERRRREKALGQRRPTQGDLVALNRTEWLKDPDEALRRHPSTREKRRRRDLRAVFVFDRDGEMQVFPSLKQAADYMEAVDVNDGEYEALYTLDGWVIDARADTRESQVELVVTDENDVDGLRLRVATHRRPGRTSTPDDLRAVANDEFRAEWERRWPRWPNWLDRRVHGESPPQL